MTQKERSLEQQLNHPEDELERLRDELARVRRHGAELEDARRAMLYLMEDLEGNRRQIEDARREWTAAFDAVSDPMFLHDDEYRIVRANRAYAERAGQPFSQFLGRPYWEVFPRMAGPLPGCKHAHHEHGPLTEEFTLPEGPTFVSRAFSMLDAAGHYQYSLHILQDVTAGRRIESERRTLGRALQQINEGIVLLDPDLRITYVNSALSRLLGRAPADLVGQPVTSLSPPSENALSEHIRKDSETPGGWAGEVVLLDAEARSIPAYLNVAGIYGDQGVLSGYVCAYTDLRPIKEALTQVETLFQVIEDLSLRLDLETIAQRGLDAACRACGVEAGAVALLDPDSRQLSYRWYRGLPVSAELATLQAPFPADEGLAGEVLASHQSRVVEDYPAYAHALPTFVAIGVRSAAAAPVLAGDRALGVLTVASLGHDRAFAEPQVRLVEAIARQLGIAVQRERLIETLRDSEARFRQVVETVPDILFVMNPRTFHLRYVSPAVRVSLGYTPDELTADSSLWQRIVHEEDRETLVHQLQDAVTARTPALLEHRAWHKDGQTLRWFEARVSVDYGADGEPIALYGALIDVTERKQAEQARGESEERLRSIVDAVPDILFVLRLPGLEPMFVSPAVTELLGFTPQEAVDDPQLWLRQVHEGDRERLLAETHRAVADGDGLSLEARFWHRDGETLRWIEIRSVIERGPTGEPDVLVGALTDITRRRETERRIRESEHLLATLMHNVPGMVYRCHNDHAWTMEFVSEGAVELTGYEPNDLLQNRRISYADLIHPDDRGRIWGEVQEALAEHRPYTLEYRIRTADDTEKWVWEQGAANEDESGSVPRLEGLITDITERKRSEQAVVRLNRALATLSAGNEALVRAPDESTLLARVCDTIVDLGGYRLAWVGYVENDEAKTLRPVAQAGAGAAYLTGLVVTWDDSETGRGPAGTAVREGRTAMLEDLQTAAEFAPWRDAAAEQGLHSVIALPLATNGEVFGVLNIYADVTGAFTADEVRLLEELANDLAFGIHTQRLRVEREQAEQALRDSEQRFRAIFDHSGEGILVADIDTHQLFMGNRAIAEMLGYSAEELCQLRIEDIHPPTELPRIQETFGRQVREQTVLAHDLPVKRKDGSIFYADVSAVPVTLEGQRYLVGNFRDITESKRADEDRRRAAEKLKQTLVATIEAVALTIEKRDPYTAGHQQRVADLCVAIARGLGLEEERIEGVRLGAMIHDIGKIHIPAEILNRPGRLSAAEFEMIKSHPAVGYDIIRGVDFPWPVADMILQHHERMDGSGYPEGLKGDQIAFEARILAVADVVEAMASHRPYRPGLGLERALQELEMHRGALYDKQVTDVCLKLFREHRFAFDFSHRDT